MLMPDRILASTPDTRNFSTKTVPTSSTTGRAKVRSIGTNRGSGMSRNSSSMSEPSGLVKFGGSAGGFMRAVKQRPAHVTRSEWGLTGGDDQLTERVVKTFQGYQLIKPED